MVNSMAGGLSGDMVNSMAGVFVGISDEQLAGYIDGSSYVLKSLNFMLEI